jgi:hypothetical protein
MPSSYTPQDFAKGQEPGVPSWFGSVCASIAAGFRERYGRQTKLSGRRIFEIEREHRGYESREEEINAVLDQMGEEDK